MRLALLVVLLPLVSSACKSAQPAPAPAPTKAAVNTGEVQAKVADAKAEKIGILAPVGANAISLWPESYGGALLVLEVQPHGALVAQGDVVAKLDARAIDEEIRKMELEVQSASVRHQGTLAKNAIDEDAARSALELARVGLERAKRALDGWKTQELAFTKRQDEISKRREEAGVEDEIDELDQLEKMYKGDELVDATEDIVIKRSRRSLEMTKIQNALSRDRARYREENEQKLEAERREEAVRVQTESLDRLMRTQAIERATRADAELRSADTLAEQTKKLEKLKQDRELFAVRAPCAGVLLHGGPRDVRVGKPATRLERGATLQARADVFTVAPPAPTKLVVDLTDADFARFQDGASVQVQALGAGGSTQSGRLSVEPYAKNLTASEGVYEAVVTLDAPLEGARYGQRFKISGPEGNAKGGG
jgi:HlyD family secretion protein